MKRSIVAVTISAICGLAINTAHADALTESVAYALTHAHTETDWAEAARGWNNLNATQQATLANSFQATGKSSYIADLIGSQMSTRPGGEWVNQPTTYSDEIAGKLRVIDNQRRTENQKVDPVVAVQAQRDALAAAHRGIADVKAAPVTTTEPPVARSVQEQRDALAAAHRGIADVKAAPVTTTEPPVKDSDATAYRTAVNEQIAQQQRNESQQIQTAANDVKANAAGIQTNAAEVQANRTAILADGEAIQYNAARIDTNGEAISANREIIQHNSARIDQNSARLDNAEKSIKHNSDRIAENSKKIKQIGDNAAAMSSLHFDANHDSWALSTGTANGEGAGFAAGVQKGVTEHTAVSFQASTDSFGGWMAGAGVHGDF